MNDAKIVNTPSGTTKNITPTVIQYQESGSSVAAR